MPASTSGVGGADGSGAGSDGGGLVSFLETPRMPSIASASSSELPPMASGSSVSSGWHILYVEVSRGLQVSTSFTRSLLAHTKSRYTSDYSIYIASDQFQLQATTSDHRRQVALTSDQKCLMFILQATCCLHRGKLMMLTSGCVMCRGVIHQCYVGIPQTG